MPLRQITATEAQLHPGAQPTVGPQTVMRLDARVHAQFVPGLRFELLQTFAPLVTIDHGVTEAPWFCGLKEQVHGVRR